MTTISKIIEISVFNSHVIFSDSRVIKKEKEENYLNFYIKLAEMLIAVEKGKGRFCLNAYKYNDLKNIVGFCALYKSKKISSNYKYECKIRRFI